MTKVNRLWYIGYYAPYNDDRERCVAMSQISKMDYISKVVKELDVPISIYSPIYSISKKFHFFPTRKWINSNGIEVRDAATISASNTIMKILARLLMEVQVFFFLITRKRDDKVLMYHSLGMRHAVSLAQLFRRYEFIMEVEELFNAAWGKENLANEIKYLKKADKYLYVNDVMPKRFAFNKPYAVCYGNYEHYKDCNIASEERNYTLIYAGVIDRKGTDVYVAIETLKCLPEKYKLKIAGYGSEQSLDMLKQTIKGIPRISYHGQLHGKEYDEFLFSGKYGLCTRVLEDRLSDYTFPSKVMVYLGHALIPVCPMLTCLKESVIQNNLLFVNSLSPREIAETIQNNESFARNTIEVIDNLNMSFAKELRKLLN